MPKEQHRRADHLATVHIAHRFRDLTHLARMCERRRQRSLPIDQDTLAQMQKLRTEIKEIRAGRFPTPGDPQPDQEGSPNP